MRVLVISDIHANLAALEAVLSAAKGRYDTVWCLGDVVGYGPDPNECVVRVRDLADVCVAGNHDWAALGKAGINLDDFNPEARRALLWTREQLRPENLAWLDELPSTPEVCGAFTITHGSPQEPVWEYILNASIALRNFKAFDTRCCLVGHTHSPALYASPGPEECHWLDHTGAADWPIELSDGNMRYIINPGSVGQPRDSDPRAAYGLLDTEKHLWSFQRLRYPVEVTQSRMREHNLPERLIARLAFGW